MWRTVAIALELLQYSTHREAEKQFPKEAVRRNVPRRPRNATVIRSEDGRRHAAPPRLVPVEFKILVNGEGMEKGTFPIPSIFKDDMQKNLSISSYKSAP